ncbi:Ldh family oxidoreductase [Alteribacillus iranensis]|uniref:Ureidoglycolate dehydrogenase (NAD+) n=1 Tax=Alteribacillus iranensis TaxID=930128 RepID=A0A1I2BF22_9BACI|nr:Ldh family oxidoreductase [Alteribacillus iranensis]SFE53750.1 ureidoglycolate dehydrogenase (NAD+) [Alteribacillus iranensis]
MNRIDKSTLTHWVQEIFTSIGISDTHARTIADHLVLADMRGVHSHGVSKTSIYTKRLEERIVRKDLSYTLMRETPVSVLIDGENSMGIPLATKGIELAIEKAKESGIGIVGINHSNHAGMLAAYTSYAADHQCIALATTSAPPAMAPWGGKEKFFGTNPLSYAVPTGKEINIVFDMATTVVAKGKIILAEQENRQIPLGWALSKTGEETTNPQEALEGIILPSGGPKGYGITFLVEVLSSLFTGASYGHHIGNLFDDFQKKQDVGQFFFVMRADLFEELDIFKCRMDQLIDEIRNVKKQKNVERIYLPGEIELEKSKDREKHGIPLTKEVVDDLVRISEKYKISIPQESVK